VSETDQMLLTATRTAQIEERAGYWLERRDFGNLDAEELAAFDAWIGKSLAHRIAYVRLAAAWTRTERLAALRRHSAEQSEPAMHKRRHPFAILAAAFVVTAMLGAGAALFLMKPRETVYTTSIGGHRTTMLADGSTVELNTDTVVRVIENADRRIVEIDRGEAYFQIKHDAARPFVVKVAGHSVTDLGTKFLVRSETGRLEVVLTEGRARLESADADVGAPSVVLTPGDVAIATARAMSVTRNSPTHLANVLGWRHGVLVFDHTTLAAAADEINRYNRKKLVIADVAAGKFMIGGTFPTNGVETIAAAAKDFFGLRVEDRGDEILISR
jgi:transmembrane sensor